MSNNYQPDCLPGIDTAVLVGLHPIGRERASGALRGTNRYDTPEASTSPARPSVLRSSVYVDNAGMEWPFPPPPVPPRLKTRPAAHLYSPVRTLKGGTRGRAAYGPRASTRPPVSRRWPSPGTSRRSAPRSEPAAHHSRRSGVTSPARRIAVQLPRCQCPGAQ